MSDGGVAESLLHRNTKRDRKIAAASDSANRRWLSIAPDPNPVEVDPPLRSWRREIR